MGRKRLTELFPFLLPLRKKQRTLFFYAKMRFDSNRYARRQEKNTLPHMLFESVCPMLNTETGFDMVYQENKVFNLKLAAEHLDGLIIEPGETFSFWERVRHADRQTPYKEALAEVNGRLVTQYGGGLCQISNLLCWLFLHTPLTITERHGHSKKDFPEPPSDAPMGVDATVAEGWLDLRARNDSDAPIQLSLTFEGENIIGRIFTPQDGGQSWRVINRGLTYYRTPSGVFEEVDVIQQLYDGSNERLIYEKTAYRNKCLIAYRLPEGTKVTEKGNQR